MGIAHKITDYELVERLNLGRFATVYKAIDLSSQQSVIVRVLHDSVVRNKSLSRWKEFINKIIELKLPHFVQILYLGGCGRVSIVSWKIKKNN